MMGQRARASEGDEIDELLAFTSRPFTLARGGGNGDRALCIHAGQVSMVLSRG
jgi:hypothetical protein